MLECDQAKKTFLKKVFPKWDFIFNKIVIYQHQPSYTTRYVLQLLLGIILRPFPFNRKFCLVIFSYVSRRDDLSLYTVFKGSAKCTDSSVCILHTIRDTFRIKSLLHRFRLSTSSLPYNSHFSDKYPIIFWKKGHYVVHLIPPK